MCQLAFSQLRASSGSIINFGSNAALDPKPMAVGHAHYAAAKAGVFALTRALAAEWGPAGIRINAVVPAVSSPMLDEYRARLDESGRERLDALLKWQIPLGGAYGDPRADLAPVLVFLVSDASRFITGQILCVDGGKGFVR